MWFRNPRNEWKLFLICMKFGDLNHSKLSFHDLQSGFRKITPDFCERLFQDPIRFQFFQRKNPKTALNLWKNQIFKKKLFEIWIKVCSCCEYELIIRPLYDHTLYASQINRRNASPIFHSKHQICLRGSWFQNHHQKFDTICCWFAVKNVQMFSEIRRSAWYSLRRTNASEVHVSYLRCV